MAYHLGEVYEELGAEPTVPQSILSLVGSGASMLLELFKTPVTFDAQSDAGKKIVGAAQTLLNRAGSPKLTVDRSLGPKTKIALAVAAPDFEKQTWLTVLTTLDAKRNAGLKYPISSSLRGLVGSVGDKAGLPLDVGGIPTDLLLLAAAGVGAWYFWKQYKGKQGIRQSVKSRKNRRR